MAGRHYHEVKAMPKAPEPWKCFSAVLSHDIAVVIVAVVISFYCFCIFWPWFLEIGIEFKLN